MAAAPLLRADSRGPGLHAAPLMQRAGPPALWGVRLPAGRLAVDLAEHHVQGADDSHHVCEHVLLDHGVQGLVVGSQRGQVRAWVRQVARGEGAVGRVGVERWWGQLPIHAP